MQIISTEQTPESFLLTLKNKGLVLVDFYATWCEPCKMLDQILAGLEKDIAGKAEIMKLDLDQQPSLKTEYTIMSVPTLMIFKNGELVWRMPGFMLQHELKDKLFSFA
jgi:thioredoxin 1